MKSMHGHDDWDDTRDDDWNVYQNETGAEDEARDEWEHQQDINDYGLTDEEMDSGDREEDD